MGSLVMRRSCAANGLHTAGDRPGTLPHINTALPWWRVLLPSKVRRDSGVGMSARKCAYNLALRRAPLLHEIFTMSKTDPHLDDDAIIAATRRWVEHAVIGLNLCPFAKAVYVKEQVRYVVASATTPEALLEQLMDELQFLSDTDADKVDTTLLIHPFVLTDFLDYNEFLDVADAAIEDMDLEGDLQVASFHPDYQFADTDVNDIENFTNRSPYPVLQLLREDSIERAVDAFPEAEEIFEKNIATMEKLGHDGWDALHVGPA